MLRNRIVTYLIICLPLVLVGQNIIPNPGFELCQTCDNRGFKELYIGVGANIPIDWNAATYGTPDIRSNFPRTGKKHGGFFLGFAKYEYLTTHLTESLKAGARYKFSFNIVPDNTNPSFAIDEIGIAFQIGPAKFQQAEPLSKLKIAYETPDKEYLSSFNYKEFSFEYVACGGEDHIIVGRFRALGQDDTLFIGKTHPKDVFSVPIYYNVDDFLMEKISDPDDLLPPSLSICPDEKTKIALSKPYDPKNILWSTGEKTQEIIVSNAGKIWVEVKISENCESIKDSLEITLKLIPVLIADSRQYICPGEEKIISPPLSQTSTCHQYKWQDGSTEETLKISVPGRYNVTVTCECDTFETFVLVDLCKGFTFLEFPNTFTPNGDQNNDNFGPYFSEGAESFIERFNLKVYNRWGKKVFESNNTKSRWSPDLKEPVDTYVYVAEVIYHNSLKLPVENFKGTVTLLR